ncbi:hypothetical protein [uncultured Actinomyces sp.]|uniref:hypothetical protein n=1 Tax=uncultured Actinomyces sp. TaxID=249061 RepID=UPI0028E52B4E|nr:hypothetical protein [uncultured Actinomyces sp.]
MTLTDLAVPLLVGHAPAPQAPADRLLFPQRLAPWRAWEGSHHRLRRARAAVAAAWGRVLHGGAGGPEAVIASRGGAPRVAVVVDAPTSSQQAALIAPLAHLRDVVVVCPPEVLALLDGPDGAGGTEARPAPGWDVVPLSAAGVAERLDSVTDVLAVGHYLPLGAGAYRWAQSHGARFVVVQHGILTPFMAPLPVGAHLLAWSEADAAFWASGRRDVSHEVVASQLLWRAAQEPPADAGSDAAPTFLGQLHGVELGRAYMTATSHDFCRATGALYRPHPAERDRLSRWTHAAWEREGITIDRSGTPLVETRSPVVSVFSTGVLEAAARGLAAWVHAPGAPDWLSALHARYSMSPWGASPTPPPPATGQEPARTVALALTRH